nr:hypothetical protein [Tanacetum cinerariifolium]
MEAHLAPKSSIQVIKIDSSCAIYSGPHDTQYCMKNLEQAFVEYASSCNNKVGGTQLKQQQDDVINKINTLWKDDRTCGETNKVEEVEEESEESKEETEEEEEDEPEYFNTFPTIEELGYHEWLLKNPRPPWVSAK